MRPKVIMCASILLLPGVVFASTDPRHAIQAGVGRTWCVDFLDKKADEDGGIIKFKVLVKAGGTESPLNMNFRVQGNWQATDKAQSLEAILSREPHSTFLNVVRSGTVVCVRLKKNVGFDDINGLEITEQNTGEGNVRTYDDTEEIFHEIARFDVMGSTVTPGSRAVMKVGTVLPLVAVPTFGKTPTQIKRELVSAFNDAYGGTGYEAYINTFGEVEIPAVPCTAGVIAGADDSGFTWSLAFTDTYSGTLLLPAVTNPALVLLAVAMFAIAVAVIAARSRRRAAA